MSTLASRLSSSCFPEGWFVMVVPISANLSSSYIHLKRMNKRLIANSQISSVAAFICVSKYGTTTE
jgi:hypothetical protein